MQAVEREKGLGADCRGTAEPARGNPELGHGHLRKRMVEYPVVEAAAAVRATARQGPAHLPAVACERGSADAVGDAMAFGRHRVATRCLTRKRGQRHVRAPAVGQIAVRLLEAPAIGGGAVGHPLRGWTKHLRRPAGRLARRVGRHEGGHRRDLIIRQATTE